MSAERMLTDIANLAKEYGLDGIKFYDSDFFVDKKRVVEFSKGLIDRGIRISWAASAHPKDVKRLHQEMAVLVQSGLKRILIGAESGSQLSLDYIKKGCTVEDIMEVAGICATHGLSTVFTFIVGIPGTSDDVEATLKMAFALKEMSGNFEVSIHFYAPLPGTPLYEEAKKLGYKPPESLKEWSEYDYCSVQIPWLSKATERKVRLFSDFYIDFLFPPTWFLSELKSRPVSKIAYRVLRFLAALRCKANFYAIPIERHWFRLMFGKSMMKRSD